MKKDHNERDHQNIFSLSGMLYLGGHRKLQEQALVQRYNQLACKMETGSFNAFCEDLFFLNEFFPH